MKPLIILIVLSLCSCSSGTPTGNTPIDEPGTPNHTIQVDGQLYEVVDADPGGNAILWRLAADGSQSHQLDIGPVSGPIVDVEALWGWMWIADRHSVFRASLESRSTRWALARRVWTTADAATIISSLGTTDDRLGIQTNSGTEYLLEADLGFRVCDGQMPPDNAYEVGQTYTHNGYIDFMPGSLPLILGVPHNGALVPDGWITDPDMLKSDGGSLAFTLALADELERLTGERPSLVINNVMRNVLNLNRAWSSETNFGNPEAEAAWNAYHDFIEAQKSVVSDVCGQGLFIDVHTQALSHRKSGLGFQLTAGEINLPDDALDLLEARSNLRGLMASDFNFRVSQAVRGPLSLGNLLNRETSPFLPNADEPVPLKVTGGTTQYFRGGFNADSHGSHHDGGPVDGIHMENDWHYINNGVAARQAHAIHVADALVEYMERWYGFLLRK